ncbi:MAG: arginine--tRNA ligase [Patescibacteria group bacterium]|nr:arginine--tRNA ligase [Patescibacteria group bacterium]
MIQGEIKRTLFEAIKKAYPAINPGEIKVERTKDPRFGDYTSNISLKISSTVGKDPFIVSARIADNIKSDSFTVEAVSGFINFKLAEDYFQKRLKKILTEKNKYATSKVLAGKKIQVEFVSANPTGPMHIGIGKSAFGGDVIANVLTRLGAKVEREYYVNDAGTQIEMLGKSALAAAKITKTSDEIYQGEYIDKWVQGKKRELAREKENPKKIGEKLAADILKTYIKPALSDMKIKFDNYYSEKSLESKGLIKKTLTDLEKRGLIYEEEGAKWFRASEYGDSNDHVVVRSDGEPAYYLSDIAYHHDKLIERKFDKVIDLWGADHHGHVQRVQAAVKAMGQKGKLDIILTQLVRLVRDGKEFRMSKRKGVTVTIEDLFELIGGPKKEASDVARFFFLSRAFNTHMDFDLDLAREHTEKNPVYYVKYAHARICGILRKAGKINTARADLMLLTDEREIELIKELAKLPEILVAIVADNAYPVHHLTFYARSVAQKFHAFYNDCRVIDNDNLALTKARLKLVEATQIVLAVVILDLLGIDAPKKM